MNDPDGPHPEPPELDDLIERLLEQTLSPADEARLQQLLKGDRVARQRYLVYLELHGALHWEHASDEAAAPRPDDADMNETMVLQALHADDAASDAEDAPIKSPFVYRPATTPPAPSPARQAVRSLVALTRRAPLWRAAAILIALSLIVVVLRRPEEQRAQSLPPPPPPPVATVTAVAATQWGTTSPPVAVGTGLLAGRTLTLARGGVELTFAGGTRIVIEGPATFTVESPTALALASGQLAAAVNGGDFVVRTPTVTVTDLGTEFGVGAGANGVANVQVFKGSVAVSARPADPKAEAPWVPKVLSGGQAANVASDGVTLDPRGAWPQQFVRSLNSSATRLDLVDLICGGDGTSGRRGTAIDPVGGTAGMLEPVSATLAGDGAYRRVPTLPVLDGCFIPNGAGGPTPVDSTGRTFSFPATAGTTYSYAWAGGADPGRDDMTGEVISATLAGIDHAQPPHAALYLHTSKGITLDLDAIRRLHPGRRVARFRCLVGNTYAGALPPGTPPPRADVFVLVDGRPRFERRALLNGDAAIAVDVPLTDGERFLTLATTDGGDDIYRDWIVLGDPVLELAQPEPTAR